MTRWLVLASVLAAGCAKTEVPGAARSALAVVEGAAVGDPCGDLGVEGCCDGPEVRYCDKGAIARLACGDGCGWDAAKGWYDCGFTGADPSGQHPDACPGGCTPDCAGKECGDDGCGGSCGGCGAGESCAAGTCDGSGVDPCAAMPAGGQCDRTTLRWCEAGSLYTYDCAKQQKTCGYDPIAGTRDCLGQSRGCTPTCDGQECGGDGCGGSCGTCAVDETCTDGACVGPACEPDCEGRECGDDGCGGVCGTCPAGDDCADGACEGGGGCTPSCAGKQCGADGCGGVCGTCPAGLTCTTNQCLESTPLGGGTTDTGGGTTEPVEPPEEASASGCAATPGAAAPWAFLLALAWAARRRVAR